MWKDKETNDILKKTVDIGIYDIPEYFKHMQKQAYMVLSIQDEEEFEDNKQELKKILLNLAVEFSSARYLLNEAAKKNSKTVDFSGTSIDSNIHMPGMHDFCVCLEKLFTYSLFVDFYVKWVSDILNFIGTKGKCYPRVISSIMKNGNDVVILKFSLVTDKDMDESVKHIKENITIPQYYHLFESKIGIPSRSDYLAVYQKTLKEWEEPFHRFVNGEYLLYSYMQENYKRFAKQEGIEI